ncbi:MAG: outer membrane protein assembly factor BamB [Limisphaerales bacterium]|jgi:outer membrane protein assembly factor BamB
MCAITNLNREPEVPYPDLVDPQLAIIAPALHVVQSGRSALLLYIFICFRKHADTLTQSAATVEGTGNSAPIADLIAVGACFEGPLGKPSSPMRSGLGFPMILVGSQLLAGTGMLCANDWPSFRGKNGDGIGTGSLPIRWDVKSGDNVLWKSPVEGLSISSPIVFEDRVYVTTAVGTDPDPEFKPDPTWGYRILRETDEQEWKILCLDAKSGRRLWERTAYRGQPKQGRHSESTYANPTPATDGTNLVTMFGSQGLYCHSLDGVLRWKKDLGSLPGAPSDNQKLDWGYSSSPIIHRGEVIVQCDTPSDGYVAVFDIETGRERIRIARTGTTTWATPTACRHDGRDILICNGYRNTAAYDLKTGQELWSLHGRGDIPVPRPVISGRTVYISSAHGGRSLYAVDLSATGVLTPDPSDDLPAGLKWWSGRQGSYIPTPLVHEGIVYVANERGMITALEADNGAQIYQSRIVPGRGTMAYASPVLAGGKIYAPNNAGKIYVLKTGRQFKLLATNDMKEQTMATPAISDGRLFIRTRRHLYCIGR